MKVNWQEFTQDETEGTIGYSQQPEGLDTIISLPPVMVFRKLLFLNQAEKMSLGTRLPLEFPGNLYAEEPAWACNGACVFTQDFVTFG